MNLLSFVIPIQGDSDVSLAIPFSGDFIFFFQCCLGMHCMFLAHILDSEIVNYQRELNGAPIMFSKAWN